MFAEGTSGVLPTTESHVIVIGHVDIEDEFAFDRIELRRSEEFVIFRLGKSIVAVDRQGKEREKKRSTFAEKTAPISSL